MGLIDRLPSNCRLRENFARLVLPERDPKRLYPRAVKIKMSNYPRKRTLATHPK